MKIRVVIEEVVVDVECDDVIHPAKGAAELVRECVEQAVKLHAVRQRKKEGGNG